jgi:purine-binding chemotaxis protein CheW
MREVVPLPAITRVPDTSPNVLGVFNSRGKIIPLIDIRPILEIRSSIPCSSDMVMILRENNFITGILINEVVTIIDIEYEKKNVINGATVIKKDLLIGIHSDPDLGNIHLLDRGKLIELLKKPLTEI